MANNHGLRTTGTHTGNFGRAKIQGKRETLDLSKKILDKPGLKIPDPNLAFTRLETAYNTTTDPKLKAFLAEQLAKRKAATTPPKVKVTTPDTTHWDIIKLTR